MMAEVTRWGLFLIRAVSTCLYYSTGLLLACQAERASVVVEIAARFPQCLIRGARPVRSRDDKTNHRVKH